METGEPFRGLGGCARLRAMVLRLSVSGPVVAMAITTALCAGKTRLLSIVVGEYLIPRVCISWRSVRGWTR